MTKKFKLTQKDLETFSEFVVDRVDSSSIKVRMDSFWRHLSHDLGFVYGTQKFDRCNYSYFTAESREPNFLFDCLPKATIISGPAMSGKTTLARILTIGLNPIFTYPDDLHIIESVSDNQYPVIVLDECDRLFIIHTYLDPSYKFIFCTQDKILPDMYPNARLISLYTSNHINHDKHI
jgi:hypothetical protein